MMRRFTLLVLLILLVLAVRVQAQTNLADYMASQLSSLTNGGLSTCEGFGQQNGANTISGIPQVNTNYWLKGVTNILSQAAENYNSGNGNNYAGGAIAISPRHCVFASHTSLSPTNVWILPNGSLYTNVMIAELTYLYDANLGGYTDIGIGLMQKTNPCFCRIFPNATNYISRWLPGGVGTVPAFVRKHCSSGQLWFYGYTNSPASWYEPDFVSGSSNAIGSFWYGNSPVVFGDYLEGGGAAPKSFPNGDTWQGGDSGSATYAVLNNEMLLVGCAYFPQYAPSVSLSKVAVDAAMANLSTNNGAPVYTTTLYDVSAFPRLNMYANPVQPIAVTVSDNQTNGGVFITSFAFTNSVTDTNGPYTLNWSFGDGATSTLSGPTHAFSSVGTNVVTLTVTDSATNATASISVVTTNILIYPITVVAGFATTLTNSVAPATVTFTNMVTDSNTIYGPYTGRWTFGDGTGTSTTNTTSHTYMSGGTYIATFSVNDVVTNWTSSYTVVISSPSYYAPALLGR